MSAGAFTSTGALVRFGLRRDRIKLPVWVLALTAFVPYVMTAYQTVFAEPGQLAGIVTMLQNPIMALFSGPGYGIDGDPSAVTHEQIFGSVYWLYMLVLVGLMNLLLISRHTRSEEQAGRTELIRANPVGRLAPLTAALVIALIANVVLGVLVAAAMSGFGVALASCALLGAGTATFGLAFAGIAAAMAQVTEFSAGASGFVGGVLGAAFLVRGVGDMIAAPGEHGTWVSWLSPLAWGQQTRVFVDDRWWPLLLCLALTLVAAGVAYVLQARRDLGAGIMSARLGRPRAAAWLRTPMALAWVIQSGNLKGWGLGLGLAALMYASFTEPMVTSFEALPDLLTEMMGGSEGAIEGYLTLTVTMFRVVLAAYAVLGITTLVAEERGQRAEPVLAARVSRVGWLGGHVAVVAAGTVVLALLTSLVSGGAAALVDDDWSWLGLTVVGSLAGLPAVWLVLGLATALFGIGPRWVGLAWVPVVVGGFIDIFGDLIDLPAWVCQISPFEHTPSMPAEGFILLPALVQLGIAAALVFVGLVLARRRNIPAA